MRALHQSFRGRQRPPTLQGHRVRRGRCTSRFSCRRCAPTSREPAEPSRTAPPHTHPQLLLAVLGPHPPPRPARRHRDPRRYPSGQPGEDAASIAAVAPTREVADGDALPRGRRGACPRESTAAPRQHPRRCAAPARRLRGSPGASCSATCAPRRRSWTARRSSTTLSPVWEEGEERVARLRRPIWGSPGGRGGLTRRVGAVAN